MYCENEKEPRLRDEKPDKNKRSASRFVGPRFLSTGFEKSRSKHERSLGRKINPASSVVPRRETFSKEARSMSDTSRRTDIPRLFIVRATNVSGSPEIGRSADRFELRSDENIEREVPNVIVLTSKIRERARGWWASQRL